MPFNEKFFFIDWQAYKITRLTSVPSIFRALLPALKTTCPNAADSLRILSLSGESLSLKLQQELHCVLENATILNLYGSTEVGNLALRLIELGRQIIYIEGRFCRLCCENLFNLYT